MADSSIGALPHSEYLDDDSLLVVEQQGTAMNINGAQFKEFGRQAVIGQVQGYVDDAQAAASEAQEAASSILGMTVSARTLRPEDPATVDKTSKDGVYNLDFGIPKGEQGQQGEQGKRGVRGAKGDPGTGLKILGYYDSLGDLEVAQPNPEAGDAYGVGAISPYSIFVYDGVNKVWKENGPLAQAQLPDDIVVAEGGASIEWEGTFGDAPHVITITHEDDAPLSADDIAFDPTGTSLQAETMQEAFDQLFTSVGDGKKKIASAITDMGVPTEKDASFDTMEQNIRDIRTGGGGADTSDATATSFDILAPKTAYTSAGKVEGVIPTILGQTIMPTTVDQSIPNGTYLGGTQIIRGDGNLTSNNIKRGVSIFGVTGALETTFQATLTVTVDIGAVVTVKQGTTELTGLSQTGTVVFDLPSEGQWSVTAVRGVTQYNSAVVNVTSSYSASLTVNLHIEYYLQATPLSVDKIGPPCASNPNYVIFGPTSKTGTLFDAYDKNLTHFDGSTIDVYSPSAAGVGDYVLLAGGSNSGSLLDTVDAIDKNLSVTSATELSEKKEGVGAASVGGYALFAGGRPYGTIYSSSQLVDAYNASLTRRTPTSLSTARRGLGCASNGTYAIFAGGVLNETISDYTKAVDAYNSNLTRSNPAQLSLSWPAKVSGTAGNYALFAFGSDENNGAVDAYDQFLTRTSPTPLSFHYRNACATVRGYAIFAGGAPPLGSGYDNTLVEIYDPYLTKTMQVKLSIARTNMSAGSIGDYALFAGGQRAYNDGTPEPTGIGKMVEVLRYI